MAMTLRLSEEMTEALRRRAQEEGALNAGGRPSGSLRDYIERAGRRDLLDRVLDEELPRYSDALRRLGE